jgi:hypothetical protein
MRRRPRPQQLLGELAAVARAQRHDHLDVANVPALLEHHDGHDHGVRAVGAVHGLDVASDLLPVLFVHRLLFADVDFDDLAREQAVVRVLVVPLFHAFGNLAGLALGVAHDEQQRLALQALLVERALFFFPFGDARLNQLRVLVEGVGRGLVNEWDRLVVAVLVLELDPCDVGLF